MFTKKVDLFMNKQDLDIMYFLAEFEIRKPESAIIFAAGFGMRMVQINVSSPKYQLYQGCKEIY